MDAGRLTRGRPVATRGVLEARTTRAGSALGPNFAVRTAFIWPALLVILFVSIFPLFASLYISLSRLELARGGFTFHFIGVENFRELLFGGERTHFLGVSRPLTALGWVVLAAGLWLLTHTLLSHGGRPGTVVVTLVYVAVGIAAQFLLGLGLAHLLTQGLPGQRFFRVVFLLPMMITPVGVAYMFRMLTDTSKGPFTPIWQALGLINFSWVNNAWGARTAILIGDIWQWTPFMFIVLVAALESQPVEPIEAATVDGASSWQIFRYITWPAILPVSMTLMLIRLIEAFKIVDLPNVMTNGGPGTATESLTYHAYINWRALNIGASAAVAYMLLFLVTFFAMIFVNLIRQRTVETL